MEYNLLKTIETNYGYMGEEEIVITPYPSDTQIIPGIGQIVNNFSIVTRLHNNSEITVSTKKKDFDPIENVQTGSGNTEHEIENNEVDNKDNPTNSSQIEFNELKRKSMDDAVYQSFLHPKMFKTNSTTLHNKKEKVDTSSQIPKTITKNVVQKSDKLSAPKSKLKHKFNVFD